MMRFVSYCNSICYKTPMDGTEGMGAGETGAVGRRGRPWPRERKGPAPKAGEG